jgi:dCMP deaminase
MNGNSGHGDFVSVAASTKEHLMEFWKEYMTRCDEIAKGAKCSHRNVGAIVVWAGSVVGRGYNRAPIETGTIPCIDGGCPRGKLPRGEGAKDYSDCIAVHAEFMAIIRAGIHYCRDATLYVNSRPCSICHKQAFASGIKEIVFRNEDGGIEVYLREHSNFTIH